MEMELDVYTWRRLYGQHSPATIAMINLLRRTEARTAMRLRPELGPLFLADRAVMKETLTMHELTERSIRKKFNKEMKEKVCCNLVIIQKPLLLNLLSLPSP